MPDCEHENTTQVLFQAKLEQHTRAERKYEVVYCKDCNRLYNFYCQHPMTAEEVEQMFNDIKAGIDAIVTATDDLKSAISESINAFRDL
jgi:hypothetical protein